MGVMTALMAMLYAYVEMRFVLVLAVPVWVKAILSFFLGLGIVNLIVVLQWGYLLPRHSFNNVNASCDDVVHNKIVDWLRRLK